MARHWFEAFDPVQHRNPMSILSPRDGPSKIDRYWRNPTLEPHRVLRVEVAGFTFEFHDLMQIQACLEYYSTKVHPSGRLPVAKGDYGGDHAETQRWYERLPGYLREESKRLRVVDALQRALMTAQDENW